MRQRLWTCFRVGGNAWAVDVLQVREILRRANPTPVPQAPPHVAGLLNLRGSIVTVVDPGVVLGAAASEGGEAGSPCLVLRNSAEIERVRYAWADADTSDLEDPGADSVALRVEAVEGVIEVPDDALVPPPANLEPRLLRFVRGAAVRPEGIVLQLGLAAVLAA